MQIATAYEKLLRYRFFDQTFHLHIRLEFFPQIYLIYAPFQNKTDKIRLEFCRLIPIEIPCCIL